MFLGLLAASLMLTAASVAQDSGQRLELNRKGETIVLEPYAPNIVRVTLSLQREPALAGPGYGVIAPPAAAGWSASQTEQADVYKSAGMVVTVDRAFPAASPRCRRRWTSADSSTGPLRARISRSTPPTARKCWK